MKNNKVISTICACVIFAVMGVSLAVFANGMLNDAKRQSEFHKEVVDCVVDEYDMTEELATTLVTMAQKYLDGSTRARLDNNRFVNLKTGNIIQVIEHPTYWIVFIPVTANDTYQETDVKYEYIDTVWEIANLMDSKTLE